MFKIMKFVKDVNYINRSISVCRILHNENNNTPKKVKHKVRETTELVMLIDQNDKVLGIKPKKETEALAKKLNLSLERVIDPNKYGRTYPAYKMFASADILREEKKTSKARDLKKLPINSRISDNDLSLKLKTVRKWLSKNSEVHIAIMSNNESTAVMKKVFKQVQEDLGSEARILSIREKEDAIKFIVMPPKDTVKKDTSKKTTTTTTDVTTESSSKEES